MDLTIEQINTAGAAQLDVMVAEMMEPEPTAAQVHTPLLHTSPKGWWVWDLAVPPGEYARTPLPPAWKSHYPRDWQPAKHPSTDIATAMELLYSLKNLERLEIWLGGQVELALSNKAEVIFCTITGNSLADLAEAITRAWLLVKVAQQNEKEHS